MAIKRWKVRSSVKGKVTKTPGLVYLDTFAPEPSDWISALYNAETPAYAGRSTVLPIYPQHRMNIRERNPIFSWPCQAEFNSFANASTVWSVEIQTAAGATVGVFNSDAGFNHLPLPVDLPVGKLKWRVTDPSFGITSAFREFEVLPDAVHVNAPTRAMAAATITAKARPRFWPDVTHYNVAPRNAALSGLVTRSATYMGGALPPATGFVFSTVTQTILTELSAIADLCLLWKITGNTIYRTEAERRIAGDGSTTGIAYWEPNETGITWTFDDAYRYALEVMGAAYDSFAGGLAPAVRQALYTNIARRIDYGIHRPAAAAGWKKLYSMTTPVFPGGKWLGETFKFGGHVHNLIRCIAMGAAAIQGDHTLYPGVWSAQTNCNELCRFALFSVRWGSSMRTDEGGHQEFRGYQEADYDFEFATNCLGVALGIDAANIPANRQAARMSALCYPFTSAYHVGGDGDDTTLRWSAKFVRAMRRAGGVVEARLTKISPYVSEAFLANDRKADDYHHLSPVDEPSLNTITAWARGAKTDTMVAFHSDMTDIDRFSVWMPATPYGTINHAHPSPGARYFGFRQQALTRRRSIYDYFGSPTQSLEGGWGAGGSFVIGMGSDFSAVANAVQGTNYARRTRSFMKQFVDDVDRKVKVLTRDLTGAVDVCLTIPVKSNPASTGYLKSPTAKRATAVEQTITAIYTGSGLSMNGSVSGVLPTVTSYADNTQVYAELQAGTSAVNDSFTFEIVKVLRAQAFDVMLGEDIHILGNHYEFATPRASALTFGTADVNNVTITVNGTGLATGTAPAGRLTPGLPVPVEISGVVTANVNGTYTATAVTDSQFTFQTAGAPAGAVTGTPAANFGVQVQGNQLHVRNGMNPAGRMAFMRVLMLKPAANLSLNTAAWRHPDNQLSGSINANATEFAAQIPHSSPKLHVWRNRIEYAAGPQLSGFLALVSPGEKPLPTVVSNTTTGTGLATVSTMVVAVEGKTYTVTHTAATNQVTVA